MAVIAEIIPPRYRDARPLAVGGMGEIFRATDSELGREVVLKVLAERYAQDSALRRRFEREALTAARLSGTPNVVTIFDVAEHNGRPIIVMEFLPGGSLQDAIDAGPVPPAQALRWLEEAAGAVDAAHRAGVVHRDLKPANLLLDERGHVRVADFGVASAVGMHSLTETGTILGTAGYLSPEQARGEHATAASDRYSLAVLAWELLVGRRPFAAESATAEALAHVNQPVPSAAHANPALPSTVDHVFTRGLEKDPASRHPSAAEFVGELRRAFDDGAGETRLLAAPRAIRAGGSARSWWLPVLVAAVLAAGLVTAFLATRGSGEGAVRSRTIVRTVTAPGRTVRETVTTAPAQQRTAAPPSSASGQALNNDGYAKMQAGDYTGALPMLEQAVQRLDGTGVVDEAYAKYNLAYTRFALGQCTDVTALLDEAEAIEGHRVEIDHLRKRAEKRC